MAAKSRLVLPSVFLLAVFTALPTSFASAQETVLYNFSIQANDGYFPIGDLVADKAGNLYGATYAGGTSNSGMVFKLAKPSTKGGAWTETILYSFTGGVDGGNPDGGVIFDSHGNLYGSTYSGGGESYPSGVVYELSPPASGAKTWTETVLFNLGSSPAAVGLNPQGSLAIDAAGNLFGVASQGGAGNSSNCGDTGCGTVFELQPPSSAGEKWTLLDIHDFLVGDSDGIAPNTIQLGPGGVLYGTTCCAYPDYYSGTVFTLSPPASSGGAWTERILNSFASVGDGYYQNAVTPNGKAGGLVGTNAYNFGGGYGTVYLLTPTRNKGSQWDQTILYTFTDGTDGARPMGGVVVDSSGNIYGTTLQGGTDNNGTVFELLPPASSGGDWTFKTLYSFAGGIDGSGPGGNLLLRGGVIYGTTTGGGSTSNSGNGTVFSIVP